ncbi:hypothetical protein CDL12_00301 [Handroanthus impetiginosus]|uniref:Uncharacterized protein n=1 Tax=Handroanthus impetiginosus TaxID=429701 RepID=A0A2G9IB09_9LAMI|nr:hypothetical protein CDL12_00301 [Handroanthus impetiginosus]
MNYVAQDANKFKNITPSSSCGSQDFDIYRHGRHNSFNPDTNPSGKTKNKPWDSPSSSTTAPRGFPFPRDAAIVPNAGSVNTSHDADRNSTSSAEKQDPVESGPQDPKGASENMDSSAVKSSASETDTKRAKHCTLLWGASSLPMPGCKRNGFFLNVISFYGVMPEASKLR